MKVLVTGHEGYIGCILTPMLTASGHEVVGLDSGLYRECVIGPGPAPVPAIQMDVRDVSGEQLRGFDAVIHLAAISNDPVGDLNRETTLDINYRASVRLAEAARAAGVERFLFSSSCSLYGAGGDELLNEDAAFNPVTPYGESKILAEQAISGLASERFSPTFLRNATAYGFSPRLRGDLVVNNLVGYALTTGEVFLKSDGTPWRPLVHIEDISRAFIAALEAPRELVHGRAFNVGSSAENYRIREVATIVEAVVPGSRVAFSATAGPDLRNYRVSCERIRSALPGFAPKWTVRAGAEELHDAYRSYGLTLEDLVGSRLQRIARVKQLQQEGVLDSSLRRAAQAVPVGTRGVS
ncbi:MAG: SDR family oxidoreductase [Dehalococcoidia bacterium]|nr:SDR family oxidoreductase [Dehalococcoidia bacterium]